MVSAARFSIVVSLQGQEVFSCDVCRTGAWPELGLELNQEADNLSGRISQTSQSA